MNIGKAALKAGLSAKAIRYYEQVGLMPQPARAENGYRHYTEEAVETLRFIHQARRMGFSVNECRNLVDLYKDKGRASADVKSMTLAHIADIDQRIAELQSIRATLAELAAKCQGDDRPDCPIINDLAQAE